MNARVPHILETFTMFPLEYNFIYFINQDNIFSNPFLESNAEHIDVLVE